MTARGFSLVELMVAMTVALAVTGAALALAMSSRAVYNTDQNRTALNQDLRGGMDLLGVDLRHAGARLPNDISRIAIVDGASGAPDTLTVRRNLFTEVLPLCGDIPAAGTNRRVYIASNSSPVPPGCNPVADSDADGWPDNLQVWRAHRRAVGIPIGRSAKVIRAYIYDPVTALGEFFEYSGENATSLVIRRRNGIWQNSYTVTNGARVYLLEDHQYRISGDVLQRVVNGDTAAALNIIDNVEDFQIRAVFQSGTIQDTLGLADPWADLMSIQITLVGRASFEGRDLDRVLVNRFLPRNVLSY